MKKVTTFLIVFISLSIYSQSPWTKEKGKIYTQFTFTSIYNYDTVFGNPDYSINGEISDNTFQFYGEYGFNDKTTLIVKAPFKLVSYDKLVVCVTSTCNPIKLNESALGNIEIGIKHNFYNKDWLISGQFSIEANTSSFDAASGIRTGYDAFTFTPLFLAGRGFNGSYIQ